MTSSLNKKKVWLKGGKHINIEFDTVTRNASKSAFSVSDLSYQSVYGAQKVRWGKHEWKVQIEIKHGDFAIGVASSLKHMDNYFYSRKSSFNYAFLSDGRKVNNKQKFTAYPTLKPVIIQTNDVITVTLDLDKKTISFDQNSSNLGVAFYNVVVGKEVGYFLAITFFKKTIYQVRLLSYKNLSQGENDNLLVINSGSSKRKFDMVVSLENCINFFSNFCTAEKFDNLEDEQLYKIHAQISQLRRGVRKIEKFVDERMQELHSDYEADYSDSSSSSTDYESDNDEHKKEQKWKRKKKQTQKKQKEKNLKIKKPQKKSKLNTDENLVVDPFGKPKMLPPADDESTDSDFADGKKHEPSVSWWDNHDISFDEPVKDENNKNKRQVSPFPEAGASIDDIFASFR